MTKLASATLKPEMSPARLKAREALLDAAQRLLIEVGYAKLTTRELAAAAGVNQGLIHYYFGSLEEVLFQAVERYSDVLIERQRAMYAAPGPFLEKWQTAARFLKEDLASGYPKIGFELSALGWNHPRFRERSAAVLNRWREVLTTALDRALDEHGVDRERFPLTGVVSLVMTSQLGLMFESLSGIDQGHDELNRMIEGWMTEQSSPPKAKTKTETKTRPSAKNARRAKGSKGGHE
jgi:AcrR family transcriptional regulator